jgi:ankyrin repeat protein
VRFRNQLLQVAGTTALMRAAQFGHNECVEVLLRAGAHCNVHNADGKTADELAVEAGHMNLARNIQERTFIIWKLCGLELYTFIIFFNGLGVRIN